MRYRMTRIQKAKGQLNTGWLEQRMKGWENEEQGE